MPRHILLVALCCATPAVAVPPASPVPPATPDDQKIVCRAIETLGSRIAAKKDCRTRRQWRDEADTARDDRNNQQNYRGRAGGI